MRGAVSAFVLVGFAALAVLYSWPLPLQLAGVLAHDNIDPLLNTWILWWISSHAPWTAQWWDAPAFAPMSGALALSEHLLGLWPLAAPLLWAGLAPQVVYNLLFIATFALCAWTMYLFVSGVTGSRSAGIVAGCLFGFAPYRLAQLAHLQILAAWWGPVALLALHRQAERGGWRWAALFGVAWLLLALTSGYHLVFFSVIAGVAMLWLFGRRGVLRRAVPVGVTWIAAGLVIAPLLVSYGRMHGREGLVRKPGEIDAYSADVRQLGQRPALSRVWGDGDTGVSQEAAFFPGAALPAGLLLALVVRWRARRPSASVPAPSVRAGSERVTWRWTIALVALSAIPFALSTIAAWAPGRHDVLGFDVSLTRPAKSLTVGWTLLVLAALASPPGRRMLQRRSVPALYVLLALVAWICTFGPKARVSGLTFMYHAPYAWLMALPGGGAMRVPPRFWLWTVLALSVLVGLGIAALRRRSPRVGLVAAAALSVMAVADGWPSRLPMEPMPLPAHDWRPLAGGRSVVELPLGDSRRDTAAMSRTLSHGRPVVNGYSGYDPVHYRLLKVSIADRDSRALQVLGGSEGLLVAIDRTAPDADAQAQLVAASPAPPSETGQWTLSYLAPAAPAAVSGDDVRVPRAVRALDGADVTAALTDADTYSRWHTNGPQRAGQGVEVSLPQGEQVVGLRLGLGPYAEDYPRALLVDTTGDGVSWQTVFAGPTTAEAMRGALAEPMNVVLRIPLKPTRASALRVRLAADHPTAWWSISSLEVVTDRSAATADSSTSSPNTPSR